MKNIDEIKKKIHTANPIFTDEVLDLLYEYFNAVESSKNNYSEMMNKMQKDEQFSRVIQAITHKEFI